MPLQDAADLDEQLWLAAGRRNPFTQLGDWVLLSSISNPAKVLFWALSAHLNTQRAKDGDREVWPSQTTLADLLGLAGKKRNETVARYVKELVAIEAVEVRRQQRGMKRRNVYVVHETPPAEYAGPRSTGDWYQQRLAEHRPESEESAGHPVPGWRGGSKTTGEPVPGWHRGTGYPGANRVPAKSGVPTPAPTGDERDESERDELSPSTRASDEARTIEGTSERELSADHPSDERRSKGELHVGIESPEPTAEAVKLVTELPWGRHRHPTRVQAHHLAALIDAASRQGYNHRTLRRHAASVLAEARSNAVAYLRGGLQPDRLPVLPTARLARSGSGTDTFSSNQPARGCGPPPEVKALIDAKHWRAS